MVKKVLACLLITILILSNMTFAADQEIPAVYLNEDFNGYTGNTPSGWEPKNNNQMFAEKVDESHGISFKTVPTSSADDVNITKNFKSPLTGNIVLEAQIYTEDTENQRAIFVLKDTSNVENVLLMYEKGGDVVTFGDKKSVAKYEPKKWLHFQIVLSTETKKYDLYLNGEKKLSGEVVPKPEFENIKSISFKSWKGGVTYYDNIRIYEGTTPLNEEQFKALLAKQSERPTEEQIIYNRLKDAVVLCVNSEFAYVNNQQVKIDENSSLMPIENEGVFFVPAKFVLKALGLNGILDAKAGERTFSYGGKSSTFSREPIESNGELLVPVKEFAQAVEKDLYINTNGLIIFSDIKNIFDSVKDSSMINEVLNLVTYRRIDASEVTPEVYKQLREKWKYRLVGDGTHDMSDPDVKKQVEDINKAAVDVLKNLVRGGNDRPYLWEDCKDTTLSKYVTQNFDKVKKMAVAYNMKGCELYKNEELKNEIISALDWLYENRYNDKMEPYENWWEWEIGTPRTLNDILVLMYDELTPEQIKKQTDAIDHFISEVPESNIGANRVWKAMSIAVRAIVAQDFEKVLRGRDALLVAFDYSTKGDGFYEDGSFIQHAKHAYTMGYGKSMLEDLCNAMYFFEDTIFELTTPKKNNVYKWIYDSFEPLMYKGAAMQMASGREISREYDDHYVGHRVMRAITVASMFAPEQYKTDLQRMLKKWILEDTVRNFYPSVPFYIMLEAKKIVADESIKPKEDLVMYKQFAAMDQFVHRREGFAFAVSMSSSRIANFEAINDENLKGWYTNSGMTFIYNDVSQYTYDFWPTVNPYRLPGITVDTRKKADSEGTGKLTGQDFVGGVEIEKTYGASAMQYAGYNSTLTAKKAWFAFDDEIVCMGTDINSSDNLTVETIVENRQLNNKGDNKLIVNGEEKSTAIGFDESIDHTLWAHLQGNYEGADIGYYFPSEPKVNFLREQRTAAWSDINKNYGTDRPITKNYLNIWFDHGKNPQNESYYYVLLPNKTAEQTKQYALKPEIRILRNDENIQAVHETVTNTTGCIFWKSGELGIIKSHNPAAVGIRERDNKLIISASDPTQKQKKIVLEVKKPSLNLETYSDGMVVTQTATGVIIEINTANSIGKTFEAVFSY